MDSSLLATLQPVLEALGDEKKTQVMTWLAREMQTRMLVEIAVNATGDTWKLAQPNPTNGNAIVFGLLHWESQRAVTILSFARVKLGEKEGVQFYKEVMFNPSHIGGPISHDALFDDLAGYMTVDDDPAAHGAANGSAHA